MQDMFGFQSNVAAGSLASHIYPPESSGVVGKWMKL